MCNIEQTNSRRTSVTLTSLYTHIPLKLWQALLKYLLVMISWRKEMSWENSSQVKLSQILTDKLKMDRLEIAGSYRTTEWSLVSLWNAASTLMCLWFIQQNQFSAGEITNNIVTVCHKEASVWNGAGRRTCECWYCYFIRTPELTRGRVAASSSEFWLLKREVK